MPNTFDAALKNLVTKHPDDWVRYIGLPARSPAEVLSADLSVVSAAADSLIRCGETVLHIEFQTGPDAELPERVLLYNVLARRQTDRPVHSVVVLLQPNTGGVPDRVEYAVDPDRGGLSFRFEVVRVWERPADEFVAGPPALVPLAALARPPAGQTRLAALPELVRRSAERLEAEVPAEAGELMFVSYLLSGMRLQPGRVASIYRGVLAMRQSSTYVAILEEGELEGVRKTINRLGVQRFGPLTPEQTDKLNRITNLDRLNRLADRLLRVDSWAALLRGR